MEKHVFRRSVTLWCLVLLSIYSCVPRERSNSIVKLKPIIISKTDTIRIYLEVEKGQEELFTEALKKYMGVIELTGNNDGEVVEYILLNCGIPFPAPWCACLLNQGLIDIGLEGPVKDPGYTPMWFTDPKRITYARGVDPITTTFKEGWIGGIYFRSKGRIAHVFTVLDDFDDYVLTIEGNTNDQGGREGNKVAIRLRKKTEIYICADWITPI
jgi:hypothetical protein